MQNRLRASFCENGFVYFRDKNVKSNNKRLQEEFPLEKLGLKREHLSQDYVAVAVTVTWSVHCAPGQRQWKGAMSP